MIDKTKDKFWEFSVKVLVDDISDFDWKMFSNEIEKCVEKNLGKTSWEYKTSTTPHYPTEYKNIVCYTCDCLTSHISIDGNDFVCLICEDKKRRDL